jgi:hypothetical protein
MKTSVKSPSAYSAAPSAVKIFSPLRLMILPGHDSAFLLRIVSHPCSSGPIRGYAFFLPFLPFAWFVFFAVKVSWPVSALELWASGAIRSKPELSYKTDSGLVRKPPPRSAVNRTKPEQTVANRSSFGKTARRCNSQVEIWDFACP